MPHELAERAWIVRVDLRFGDKALEQRWLAVASPDPAVAALNLDRFPGIDSTDPRAAVRELEQSEIQILKLRPGAVRPLIPFSIMGHPRKR
jgi:hypothetical protein